MSDLRISAGLIKGMWAHCEKASSLRLTRLSHLFLGDGGQLHIVKASLCCFITANTAVEADKGNRNQIKLFSHTHTLTHRIGQENGRIF